MRKILMYMLIVLVLIQSVAAQYADVDVKIDKYDLVTITGETDYPNLLAEDSEQYITKVRGVRTFKLETAEPLSGYITTISLPSGTTINKIESSGLYRIENQLGRLSIITFGENQPISIMIEYTIPKASNLYWLLLIPLLFVIIAAYFLIKRLPKKNKKPDFKGLTHRQKQIMKLLIDKNKPLTQTDIETELKLPKSSVSRNIHTLELKGKVEKEKVGMSNKICLKKGVVPVCSGKVIYPVPPS